MREFVVGEQRAAVVGYDELIGRFAIADRVRVALVIFNQTDDFKLERLAVVRFDDEDVA